MSPALQLVHLIGGQVIFNYGVTEEEQKDEIWKRDGGGSSAIFILRSINSTYFNKLKSPNMVAVKDRV